LIKTVAGNNGAKVIHMETPTEATSTKTNLIIGPRGVLVMGGRSFSIVYLTSILSGKNYNYRCSKIAGCFVFRKQK